MIYFVQRSNGDIKIGSADSVCLKQRIRVVSKDYGGVDYLGAVCGNRVIEHTLHDYFYHSRIALKVKQKYTRGIIHPTGETEWFYPTQNLLRYIDEYANKSLDYPREPIVIIVSRLASVCDDRGISLNQLCKDVDLNHHIIHRWYCDRKVGSTIEPLQPIIATMVRYLNCSVGDVFKTKDIPTQIETPIEVDWNSLFEIVNE